MIGIVRIVDDSVSNDLYMSVVVSKRYNFNGKVKIWEDDFLPFVLIFVVAGSFEFSCTGRSTIVIVISADGG